MMIYEKFRLDSLPESFSGISFSKSALWIFLKICKITAHTLLKNLSKPPPPKCAESSRYFTGILFRNEFFSRTACWISLKFYRIIAETYLKNLQTARPPNFRNLLESVPEKFSGIRFSGTAGWIISIFRTIITNTQFGL